MRHSESAIITVRMGLFPAPGYGPSNISTEEMGISSMGGRPRVVVETDGIRSIA